MPGLRTHDWHPITFSLIVDDFGVKYIGEEHAQHLLQMVQKYYTCSFKKEGERYCGLTIKWDYVSKKVHLLMPSYIKKALKRFQHPHLLYRRINCIGTSKSHTVKKSNNQKTHLTPPHTLIKQERSSSKRSRRYSSVLCKLLTQ
jgi:hypothetical protein